MIASPVVVGRGSTRILNEVEPTNAWSRAVYARVLSVLSSSVQVAPPSIERRKPTPELPVSPSPVATKMIDWLGSLLRPKTAMLPVLRLLPGPRSVSGIQVGWLFGSRKLVVFQTPPLAPET